MLDRHRRALSTFRLPPDSVESSVESQRMKRVRINQGCQFLLSIAMFRAWLDISLGDSDAQLRFERAL
ncbi:hypothetical protein MPL3365_530003 [Mesorhizobium plurifarium]|uniref:Uncharacterized protein n=1 Tax=Mesorhizobium plurifarium TaxID=69974 RepID=A0A090GG72_MESPL|nr:hypothetical protein MPL3365_530003 [Mesorhizobium plurifarium]